MPPPIRPEYKAPGTYKEAEPPAPGWWEEFGANIRIGVEEAPTTKDFVGSADYFGLIEAVGDVNGKGFGDYRPWSKTLNQFVPGTSNMDVYDLDQVWRDVDDIKRRNPNALKGVTTREDFEKKSNSPRGAQSIKDRDVAQRGTSLTAQFGGAVVGGLTDPTNLIPLGGAAGGIGRRMLEGAIGNMVIETVQQPLIVRQKEKAGEDYGLKDAALNIAAAGVGGAVLPAAFKGAGLAIDRIKPLLPAKLRGKVKTMADVPDDVLADVVETQVGKDNLTPDLKAALHVVRQQAEVDRINPFIADAAGQAEHDRRLSEAMAALYEGGRVSARAQARQGVAPSPVAAPKPRAAPVAPAGGGGYDAGQVKALIRGPESGGNDNAINQKGSSASGRYQFIEGTFKSLYARVYGGDANAAWANSRFDVTIQERLMDRLIADNATILSRGGLPVDNGNLYVMHVLGSGNGPRLLRAPGDTPVASLLSPAIVSQNPTYFGGGRTVAQALAAIRGRVGGRSAGSSAPGAPDTSAIDAELLRAQTELDAANAALSAPRGPLIGDDVASPVLRDGEEENALPDFEAPSPPRLDPEKVYELTRPALVDYVGTRSNSLQVPALARALGVDETQTQALLMRRVNEPGSGLVYRPPKWVQERGANGRVINGEDGKPQYRLREGRVERAPRTLTQSYDDVLSVIARGGGIRDDEGHDIGTLFGKKRNKFVPAAGPLIRKEGRSLSEVRDLLEQGGWFPGRGYDQDGLHDISDDEVLDLLGRAASGERVFHPDQSAEALERIQRRNDANRWRSTKADRDIHDKMQAEFGKYDHDFSESDMDAAMELVRAGADTDTATIEVLRGNMAQTLDEVALEGDSPAYDLRLDSDGNPIGASGDLDPETAAWLGDRDGRSGLAGRAEGESEGTSGDGAEDSGSAERVETGPLDPEALSLFDGPDSPGVKMQADSLSHDFQMDAFGTTAADVKAALERQGEGRLKGDAAQKAPGSDGGLFDAGGRQADIEEMSFQLDENGDVRNAADIAAEFDLDASIIKTIKDCL